MRKHPRLHGPGRRDQRRRRERVEGDAAKAVNDTYSLTPVGRATGVTIQVDVGDEAVPRARPALRDRAAARATSTSAGTIGRAHVNGALLKLMLGDGGAGTPARGAVRQPVVQPQPADRERRRSPATRRRSPCTASSSTSWSSRPARGRLRPRAGRRSRRSGSASRTRGGVSRRDDARRADELLLGASATHIVEIPPEVLAPAGADGDGRAGARSCCGRSCWPTSSAIQQAAREDGALTSVLMVQQALVEPKVTVDQVNRMHAGLVEFLLRRGEPHQRAAPRRRRAGGGRAGAARARVLRARPRVRLDARRVRGADGRPGARSTSSCLDAATRPGACGGDRIAGAAARVTTARPPGPADRPSGRVDGARCAARRSARRPDRAAARRERARDRASAARRERTNHGRDGVQLGGRAFPQRERGAQGPPRASGVEGACPAARRRRAAAGGRT